METTSRQEPQPRLTMAESTVTSPPPTPESGGQGLAILGLRTLPASDNAAPLTPPLSPLARVVVRESSQDTPCKRGREPSSKAASQLPAETCIYPYLLSLCLDAAGRPIEYGRGAWSSVYKATSRPTTSGMLATPSTSPQVSPPIVAVKAPSGRAANSVLQHEARILSHLQRISGSTAYIVPFHGFVETSSSIVLTTIPLTLSSYLATRTVLSHSKLPYTDPILGTPRTWLALARHLISALDWLHNTTETSHGDIKPQNILLQASIDTTSPFPFRPLLVDFSSAFHHGIPATSSAFSALTREYTAPELLSSAVLQDPTTVPTPSSDVFSLGVTLLAAATGNVGIYSGPFYVKNARASQGWDVIHSMRNEEGGLRIPRGGVVESIVEPAVRKLGEGRIGARAWKEMVETAVQAD